LSLTDKTTDCPTLQAVCFYEQIVENIIKWKEKYLLFFTLTQTSVLWYNIKQNKVLLETYILPE